MENTYKIQDYLTERRSFDSGNDLQKWALDFAKQNIAFCSNSFIILFLKSSPSETAITGGKFFNSYKDWESYFLKMRGDSKHIAILPEKGVLKVGFSLYDKGIEFSLKNKSGTIEEKVSFFRDRLKKVPTASLKDIIESIHESVKATI